MRQQNKIHVFHNDKVPMFRIVRYMINIMSNKMSNIVSTLLL